MGDHGDYRCGALSLRSEHAQAGLVIIDMQRDFLEPGGFGAALGNDVSLLRKTIPPTRRLLEAARKAGLTIIHTREGHRPDLADLPTAKKSCGRLAIGIGDPGPMGRILVRGEPGHDMVVEDCVGSYFPGFQEMGLRMIKAQGGIFGWLARFIRSRNSGAPDNPY